MKLSVFRAATAVSAAVFLLSACSGSAENGSAGLIPAGNGRVTHRLHLTGTEHVLYVADYEAGLLVFKYGTWQELGTISEGVSLPVAVWVDKLGNLYVGNAGASDVTEYDSSGNLIFTYSFPDHRYVPNGITTDRHGNVFATAYYDSVRALGTIEEFSQQSNNIEAQCSAYAWGIAVNRRGGVFATPYSNSSGTNLVLYPGGLDRYYCQYIAEPVNFGSPDYGPASGAVGLDRQGNLLVGVDGAIDVIAPPYTSITGTLGSGWGFPTSISLNKSGTRAIVTDVVAGSVTVLSYPSGSTIAKLSNLNGLIYPYSAVDSHNYVP